MPGLFWTIWWRNKRGKRGQSSVISEWYAFSVEPSLDEDEVGGGNLICTGWEDGRLRIVSGPSLGICLFPIMRQVPLQTRSTHYFCNRGISGSSFYAKPSPQNSLQTPSIMHCRKKIYIFLNIFLLHSVNTMHDFYDWVRFSKHLLAVEVKI